MESEVIKFVSLTKVDETTHRVYGLVSCEEVDSDREICDYPTVKASYLKWSTDTLKKTTDAGQEPSFGNIRLQHKLDMGGKATKIETKDDSREIWLESEPLNDEVWRMLKGGFLTGYSQEGKYLWRKCETCGNELPRMRGENFCQSCAKSTIARYGTSISGVSYVDRPAQPDAVFTYVRADGTCEVRKFQSNSIGTLSESDLSRIVKALLASLDKSVKYLVPEGQHLPYTDESGKPSHSHMGAAWAALHGGYRGNKYEGPGKEKAIAQLKEIYRQEGMELPSEKAVLDELRKFLEASGFVDSALDTELAKYNAWIAESMAQLSAAKGPNMKPEDIKKCAAAMGISEDEFKKNYVAADDLAKAKKGLAALHAHIQSAIAHHEEMHHAHKALGGMHEKHVAHLQKCMKAASDVMGSDEKEAEKALKALVDELKGSAAETPEDKAAREAAEKAAAAGTLTKAEAQKLIDDAVKKAVDALPAPDPAGLRIVPRGGEPVKATATQDTGASPF